VPSFPCISGPSGMSRVMCLRTPVPPSRDSYNCIGNTVTRGSSGQNSPQGSSSDAPSLMFIHGVMPVSPGGSTGGAHAFDRASCQGSCSKELSCSILGHTVSSHRALSCFNSQLKSKVGFHLEAQPYFPHCHVQNWMGPASHPPSPALP
jgi:hypothetical protein